MEPTNKLGKTLLGAGLALALGFALLTSMGQAQAEVLADARDDYLLGINAGDPGILDATGTGTWNYLASDTANPTLDTDGLNVLSWNVGNTGYQGVFISGSTNTVDRTSVTTTDEIRVHPSSPSPSFTVVRWIAGAGEAGVINIAGNVRKVPSQIGGGGVTFEIFVDGISVFNFTVGGFDKVGSAFGETATVGVGSTVDFVVGPNGGDSFDSTGLKATITSVDAADHYNAYEVRSEAVIGGGGKKMNELNIDVTLEDQFGTSLLTVRKAKLLLVPVDKNGEGIVDETTHLVCYDLRDPAGGKGTGVEPLVDVAVDNQFNVQTGDQVMEVRKLKMLCVPSTKKDLP